jgi:hypothetical protein
MAKDNKHQAPRDVLITIRVSEEERAALLKLSLEKGYPNLSAFVRSLIPTKQGGV